MKSILFADDQNAVGRSFCMVVERMEDVIIVGYASDGEAALRMCEELNPDVMAVHLRIAKLDGMLLMGALSARNLKTRVMIYTASQNATLLRTVQSTSPAALFHKEDSLEDFRTAIRAAAAGGFFMSPTVASVLKNGHCAEMPLSAKELIVAKMLMDGMLNKQICSVLKIAEKTVRCHREHIYRKLKVRDVPGLIHWMSRANLEN